MAHEDGKSKGWSIAEARRRFSDVVGSAAREPQALYKRGRVVAAVIDAEELEQFRAWRAGRAGRTLAEAFEELREICRAEKYELRVAPRADRPNPFADGPAR